MVGVIYKPSSFLLITLYKVIKLNDVNFMWLLLDLHVSQRLNNTTFLEDLTVIIKL